MRLELEKARKRVLETEKRIWKAEDTHTSFPKMDDKSRLKNKGASYMLDFRMETFSCFSFFSHFFIPSMLSVKYHVAFQFFDLKRLVC